VKPGDRVEYAAHAVDWQSDGTPLPTDAEDWRPATVLAAFEHPVPTHTPHAAPDAVVNLQPEDGQPPFDLNAKLVRPRK
jgi:hypothetical protein